MAKTINLGKVGLTFEGDYDSSKNYASRTCVFYNHVSWASKKDVPAGIAPGTSEEYWQKVSERGAQGIQGERGPQGNSAFDGTGIELVNNLTQGGEASALSAEQGKILKEELTELESDLGKLMYDVAVKTDWSYKYDLKATNKVVFKVDTTAASFVFLYIRKEGEENYSIFNSYQQFSPNQEHVISFDFNVTGIQIYFPANAISGKATITVATGVYLEFKNFESKISSGYIYKGVATLATVPDNNTKGFYLAKDAGTYTSFLDANKQPLIVAEGINVLIFNGAFWSKECLVPFDAEPSSESKNLVTSGGVAKVYGKYVENPEYMSTVLDAEGKVIEATKGDGTKVIGGNIEVEGKMHHRGVTTDVVENPEYMSTVLDAEGKVISHRDNSGVLHENVGIKTNHLHLSDEGMSDFAKALKNSGFSGVGDWSDAKSLEIPIPRCAIVNITNEGNDATWPVAKGVNLKYFMQFWDMQGNYFKKEIIMNAQGTSSMAFEKKNGSVDICNNNGWNDDDTFSIKFGDWVAQDSFHFKAYHADYLRGSCVIAYQIAREVYKTRGLYADVPWKKALINFDDITSTAITECSKDGVSDVSLQIDNGARCMPDGFPAIFYLNGEFYGIYSWQLKKHRDNYHMKSSNPKHIHLDGALSSGTFWKGNVSWDTFEVRNPKNLVYAEPHDGTWKYDADLVTAEIAGNADGSSAYDTWVQGSYPVGKIVKFEGRYYLNTVSNNQATPIYDADKNADDSPDFKNKTKCGWINCTNTIKVKESIINLSKRSNEINNLDASDSSAAKKLFDDYFDADNIIDYQLINMAISDPDAFAKNWQWVTYDGIKWYVCQYDKDMSLGNHFTGMFTRKELPGWYSASTSLPTGLALRYYFREHTDRWKELVNKGIFTAENIKSKILDWVARIGQDNYKKEWEKWSEAPCNRDSLIDFNNWRFAGEFALYSPDGPIWDSETQYSVNQKVWFECGKDLGYFLQFEAITNNLGKPCLTGFYKNYPVAMGYRDSMWRFFKFVEANLAVENSFINKQ